MSLAKLCAVLGLIGCSVVLAEDHQVLPPNEQLQDRRLGPLQHLNGYFPFEVPETAEAWQVRARELRRRVQVAMGLWPLPQRTPLKPVIHGRVRRAGFTVERVYFESVPGHFVTGLLFRPAGRPAGSRYPAVLCPHGHGGRLQDYGADKIRQLIADGAERFEASGRFPKLARCAHLARMGCVSFIFDMLGYADSQQITRDVAHGFRERRPSMEGADSWGLFSTQAELRLQSVMGIQTWNAIRCLDFLEQLPDVDPERIAVTGGSGGGTQTILLGALDNRPVAAFPNGMVSTAMQGGCTCENATLLRVDAGNVELAALFGPKPQAMTAANDWTKEMMTKGYPELQRVYRLLGAPDNVYCRPLLHFPHNYNYVSRATMYQWFNQHLGLELDMPFLEEDYQPLEDEELRVWDTDHPAPPGGDAYERLLTRYLADTSDAQLQRLRQDDAAAYRQLVREAVETLVGRGLPDRHDVERTKHAEVQRDGYLLFKEVLRVKSRGEVLPVITLWPRSTPWRGDVVLWVDGERGKQGVFEGDRLRSPVRTLLQQGTAVVSADLFLQGEFRRGLPADLTQQRVVENGREAAAYTFGYNHTLFAQRVHDLLTLVASIRGYQGEEQLKRLHVVGTSGAGPLAAALRAVVGDQVDKLVADTEGFRFASLTSYRDWRFWPGIVKYGDVPVLLELGAPAATGVIGEVALTSELRDRYRSRPDALQMLDSLDAAMDWLHQTQ